MIKVKLNKYWLDISDDKHAKQYERIQETCTGNGFELYAPIYYQLKEDDEFDSFPCEQVIDEKRLSDNQFNTVEGFRIFHWYESIKENSNIKTGYYLTGDLEELKKAQDNQLICGYCDERYSALEARASKLVFCNACLGRTFLVESELKYLRLKAVSDNSDRQELSESEKNQILPLFHSEQKKAHKVRLTQNIEMLIRRLNRELDSQLEQMAELETLKPLKLQIEFYGKLLDFGVCEKPIYYRKNGTFVFNWQEKMSDSEIIELQKKLEGFPFEYSIKIAGDEDDKS